MVLPLYLAMTPEEMADAPALPRYPGLFSPPGQDAPPGAMLILDDRCPGCHDPQQVASAVCTLEAESVLLDFEREPEAHTAMVANALFEALPCPVAAPPGFIEDPASPIFLPPCPLHVPLADHLRPWRHREIWLDMTMAQQTITVTPEGAVFGPLVPADRQAGGWTDEILLCRCRTEISNAAARFILFDTPETLEQKLALAAALGVTRAVGLYQEFRKP